MGGGVPGPGGTWSRGVYLVLGGTWSRGYLVQGHVPGPVGDTWSGGVPGPEGCTWSRGVSGTPPCEQNHTHLSKHYLAPTSWRAVIIFLAPHTKSGVPSFQVYLHWEKSNAKANFFPWSLWTHLEAMSLSRQYKRTLIALPFSFTQQRKKISEKFLLSLIPDYIHVKEVCLLYLFCCLSVSGVKIMRCHNNRLFTNIHHVYKQTSCLQTNMPEAHVLQNDISDYSLANGHLKVHVPEATRFNEQKLHFATGHCF